MLIFHLTLYLNHMGLMYYLLILKGNIYPWNIFAHVFCYGSDMTPKGTYIGLNVYGMTPSRGTYGINYTFNGL